MKKAFLIFTLALISLVSMAQITVKSPYHNIYVKELIHTQGDSLDSCYIVINDLSISSLIELKAMYRVSIYKSKAKFTANSSWTIQANEINNAEFIQFTAEFSEGDLYEKISDEYINKLLAKNPTWERKNIIKE